MRKINGNVGHNQSIKSRNFESSIPHIKLQKLKTTEFIVAADSHFARCQHSVLRAAVPYENPF